MGRTPLGPRGPFMRLSGRNERVNRTSGTADPSRSHRRLISARCNPSHGRATSPGNSSRTARDAFAGARLVEARRRHREQPLDRGDRGYPARPPCRRRGNAAFVADVSLVAHLRRDAARPDRALEARKHRLSVPPLLLAPARVRAPPERRRSCSGYSARSSCCQRLALFATGVALGALGPGTALLLPLHKASFVVWVGAMSLHVLGHIRKMPPSRRATSGGGRLAARACARCSSPWRSSRGRLSPSRRCRGSSRGCTRCGSKTELPLRASRAPRTMIAMRILVVEDEAKLGRLLVRGLDEEGHAVDVAATARRRSGWRAQRRTTRSCST